MSGMTLVDTRGSDSSGILCAELFMDWFLSFQ